ncbi:helix-turn-helix domain-containing protein [Stigmatella aurantiaca]|uniref:Bacterial regulatory protein LysR, HTH motif:Helix-turn-helix, Fis-type:LysR substrate binding domain n=1 Tax=Stigmatella aurantiaca (strain DW4/3-1) TaxID=378806 RepID=Q092K9_STIAD|nr:LysR family transcriptional regulator [Stigmatella aurantiaca]ADO74231.1 regulatory protein, LysR domain protein [Stigmatella aurantiaca DW4/3-1]EAU66652.1 bacterial regulatory protein LysR, HTH motif:Helix-turn-helix, Fis-type:LysR substrate binding domain [Stigmatella aurantiaca DW4/3-1]
MAPAIDSLLDGTVFTRVVTAGSLSAAARELGMSLAAVSKRLEEMCSTPRRSTAGA